MPGLSRLNLRSRANRLWSALHHKLEVKTLVKLTAGLVVVILLLMVTGLGSTIADKLIFYARVAQLSMQQPDTKLAMPLPEVTKSQIADTWHAPRGTDRMHEGQDIFAPKGTPILSATKGFVYNIGENNLGGQTVSVIGAGGRVYYYAHLDAYAPGLAVGERVNTRTVLGYVGTTGNAQGTPPHLHFGIYTSNGAINPLPLLADRPVIRTPNNAPRVTNAAPQRTIRNRRV